jgi:hypothetical protein
MKRFLGICGGILLIILGGAGWVVLQRIFHANPPGIVRGEETSWPAFWKDGELFLAGGVTKRIYIQKAEGVRETPLPETYDIRKAATTYDQSMLLVVRKEGEQNVVWKYVEGAPPVSLLALRGEVRALKPAPSSQRFFLIENRDGQQSNSLFVLQPEDGTINQASTDAEDALWVGDQGALVSLDSRGGMWYHTIQLSGRVDPPQYLEQSFSTPAMRDHSTLIFLGRDDTGNSLRTYSLTTREQRLLAPLTLPSMEQRYILRSSSSGKSAILIVPESPDQENGTCLLIHLDTGATERLPLLGRDVRWVDEDAFIIEQVRAGVPYILNYRIGGSDAKPVLDEGQSLFAS